MNVAVMRWMYILIALIFSLISVRSYASGPAHDSHEEKEEFGTAEILHHISDDFGLHIGPISIPLPVMLYFPGQGWDVFSSTELHHADEQGLIHGKYLYHHGKLTVAALDAQGHPMVDEHGHPEIAAQEARLINIGGKDVFYNFSITKNVFGMLLSVLLLFFIFRASAQAYARREGMAPKGLQSLLEPLILFVRDDVVKPSIGEKHYRRFMPLMLTIFFFIWINNLLGLIPFLGGLNVTGNIAVTFALAAVVLVVQLAVANKNFWGHIFWFPGVPVPVKILLLVIELVGLLTKPFSLMIRLFANISAGHIIIMSIIGITFAFQSVVGHTVGVVTSLFTVVMLILELLVAAIQAYIFTLLGSLMLGAAVEEHDHGHEHAH
ncbi:MAG: F0F1 ATP synthase subunit A [Flavobacteriales bacterium]